MPTLTKDVDRLRATRASYSAVTHAGSVEDWDTQLRLMGGHFLQSALWQRVQRALGYQVLRDQGSDWMWSGALRAGYFPRYVYVPYGPTLQPGGTHQGVQSVTATARANALDFARLEPFGADPRDALARSGALATRSIQPRWTAFLDISVPEEMLRRGLSSGHRSSINGAARRGLAVYSTRDPSALDIFLELRRRNRRRGGYVGQAASYHRTVGAVLMPLGAATLYVATASDAPVASALCFDFADTRYYAHAVSDPESGRRLGAAAPLVWRMIMDARAEGLTRFDFWGVTSGHDPHHPWAGLTQFKMAFGAAPVARWGTWHVPVRRWRSRLYRALQSLHR